MLTQACDDGEGPARNKRVRSFMNERAAWCYKDPEADEDPYLANQSSAASGRAQATYEWRLLREARAIVNGRSDLSPTVEHLRILMNRLRDRSRMKKQPF